MGKKYIHYDQHQRLLVPPSLEDWLPDEHLARFVNDTIDEMELDPFYAHHEQSGELRGRPPYDPAMMLKVLVYGYCTGIRSSRKLEQAVEDIIAFRYLTGNNLPKHAAIGEFRRIHRDRFKHAFIQVLRIAQKAGLLEVGLVTVDGTKLKANAALDRNKTHEDLSKLEADLEEEIAALEARVEDMISEAEQVDEEEDALYGDARGDELPAKLRGKKDRLERIREAKAQLEQEGEERAAEQKAKVEAWKAKMRQAAITGDASGIAGKGPKEPDASVDPDAKRNTTDPDSRVMKRGDGFIQGYNAQAAVAPGVDLIVGARVSQEANDQYQLIPMLDEVNECAGAYPDAAAADAGYWVEAEIMRAPGDVELFVATQSGEKMRKQARDKGPPRGPLPGDAGVRERMERRLATKRGKQVYGLRGQSVEPRFGRVRQDQGFSDSFGFLMRGLEGVEGEWFLVCAAQNVSRLWRLGAAS